MNIKSLRSMSKSRASKYRTKAIGELEYYMEEYNTSYPLWDDLWKVLNALVNDDYLNVMDHMHSIIADGYYAGDILCDYKRVKKIYLHILRYVTYRTLQNDADCGIDNLKRYEEMGY